MNGKAALRNEPSQQIDVHKTPLRKALGRRPLGARQRLANALGKKLGGEVPGPKGGKP